VLHTNFSKAIKPSSEEPDIIKLGDNRYFESSGAYITVIAKVPDYDPYLLCGETPELRQYMISVAVNGFVPDILNKIRTGLSEINGLKDGEYKPYISVSGSRGSNWRKETSGGDFPKSEDIITQVRKLLEIADAYKVFFTPEELPFKNSL